MRQQVSGVEAIRRRSFPSSGRVGDRVTTSTVSGAEAIIGQSFPSSGRVGDRVDATSIGRTVIRRTVEQSAAWGSCTGRVAQ
jgi:hypothetical protein